MSMGRLYALWMPNKATQRCAAHDQMHAEAGKANQPVHPETVSRPKPSMRLFLRRRTMYWRRSAWKKWSWCPQ